MSSPVLAITERSAPRRACIPAASLPPPVPPASSATFIGGPPGGDRTSPSRPVVAVREPGDPNPGVSLVADVDRDQKRGQLLGEPRGLESSGVDRPQATDQLD